MVIISMWSRERFFLRPSRCFNWMQQKRMGTKETVEWTGPIDHQQPQVLFTLLLSHCFHWPLVRGNCWTSDQAQDKVDKTTITPAGRILINLLNPVRNYSAQVRPFHSSSSSFHGPDLVHGSFHSIKREAKRVLHLIAHLRDYSHIWHEF